MRIWSICLLLLVGWSACKKEWIEDLEQPLPIHQQPYWASFTASHHTTHYGHYSHPVQVYSARYTKKQQPVEAGTVVVNALPLRFDKAVYEAITFGTPLPDTIVWEVTASADFPAFTHQSTMPAPQLGKIYPVGNPREGGYFNLMSAFTIGADSTLFELANQRYIRAGSVRSHTFTAKDLEKAPRGYNTARITAVAYEKVQIEGVWMEFRKAQVQEITVKIGR
jgi:hypothetical protein